MTVSEMQQIRDDLRRDERLRLLPYDDATGLDIRPGNVLSGQLTIGYGHNLSERGITTQQAEDWLDQDIRFAIMDLFRTWPWIQQLDGPRQVALTEMCFNLGVSRLKGFKKFLALMYARNYEQAAVEALDSHWADQVGARATRIASIIHSGELKG